MVSIDIEDPDAQAFGMGLYSPFKFRFREPEFWAKWNNIFLDSIENGFLEFMIATRLLCVSIPDVLSVWSDPFSHPLINSIDGSPVTYGRLFEIYCFRVGNRNGIPSLVMEKLVRIHATELNKRYEHRYEIVNGLWEEHIALTTIKPANVRAIQRALTENDNEFNTRYFRSQGIVLTPFELASDMVSALSLETGMTVFDPMCRRGVFLLVSIIALGTNTTVSGIEQDEAMAYFAEAVINPFGDKPPKIEIAEPLKKFSGTTTMPKYDAVLGNPPYNTPRCENNRSYDLYPQFIDLSVRLSENVCLVTPSRWYAKMTDSGRDNLRNSMVNDYGLKKLVTVDPKEMFGIDIKGGTSFFSLKNGHSGLVEFDGHMVNLKEAIAKYGAIIADDPAIDRAVSLVAQHGSVAKRFNTQWAFAITSNHATVESDGVPCLFSKMKGGLKMVARDQIKNTDLLDKWKVVITRAIGDGTESGGEFRKFIRCVPSGTAVSQSFVFFDFDTEAEQIEFFDYVRSDAVLQLVATCKVTQDFTTDVFRFVPDIRDASLLEAPTDGLQEAA